MDELSEDDKLVVNRAQKSTEILIPAVLCGRHSLPVLTENMYRLSETIRGFREILEGKHDDIPESYFLNAGSIDEVRARMK